MFSCLIAAAAISRRNRLTNGSLCSRAGLDHLDRDERLVRHVAVPRKVDGRLPTAADLAHDLVGRPEGCSGSEVRHGTKRCRMTASGDGAVVALMLGLAPRVYRDQG
jgi:hypothetical protein